MKKLGFILLMLISVSAFSQRPQTIYEEPSISAMKTYFGNATRIHVTATNEDYILCTDCTVDESVVYLGANGRKWEKFKVGELTDTSSLSNRINSKVNTSELQGLVSANTHVANSVAHAQNKNNPHDVTKAQVGLSNADNTSDVNKPISAAQLAALNKLSFRTDRGYYNSRLQIPFGIGVLAFGHSIVNESAATTKDSAFIYKIGNSIGGTITNTAPPGATLSQISKIIEWNGLSTSNMQLGLYMAGINDIRFIRSEPIKLHLVHAARHFAVNRLKDTLITAAQLTETGTWASANLDTAYTFRTKGRQTTTFNSYAQFTTSADNFFVVFGTSSDLNGYTDSVLITAGEVPVATIKLNGKSDTTSQYVFIMPRTPYFSTGGIVPPYQVKIYNKRAGKAMKIDYVGWLKDRTKQTPGIVFATNYVSLAAQQGNIGRGWFDTCNNAIAQDIDTVFTRFGHAIAFAQVNDEFDPEIMTADPTGVDGIHPTDRGHGKIFESALRVMQMTGSKSAASENALVVGTPGVNLLTKQESDVLIRNANFASSGTPNDYNSFIETNISGDPQAHRMVFGTTYNSSKINLITMRGDSLTQFHGKLKFSNFSIGYPHLDVSGNMSTTSSIPFSDISGTSNIALKNSNNNFSADQTVIGDITANRLLTKQAASVLVRNANFTYGDDATNYNGFIETFVSGDPVAHKMVIGGTWNGIKSDLIRLGGDSTIKLLGKTSSGAFGINLPTILLGVPRVALDVNDINATIRLGRSDSEPFHSDIKATFTGGDPTNTYLDFLISQSTGTATDKTNSLRLKGSGVVQFPAYTSGILQTNGSGNISAGNVPIANLDTANIHSAVWPALNLRELTANKSTSTSLGSSNTLYPTQNAVKVYTDTKFAPIIQPVFDGIVTTNTAYKVISPSLVTSTDTLLSIRLDAGVVRSFMNARGQQTWYFNNGTTEMGRMEAAMPGGTPGIAFFNSSGTGRTQIRALNTGGFSIGATTGSSNPTDYMLLSNDGKVGIGTTSPNASSVLDLTSTTRGFLPPRMTKTQRDAISSPAQGLLVFVTDNGGYLCWYNSGWIKLAGTAD